MDLPFDLDDGRVVLVLLTAHDGYIEVVPVFVQDVLGELVRCDFLVFGHDDVMGGVPNYIFDSEPCVFLFIGFLLCM